MNTDGGTGAAPAPTRRPSYPVRALESLAYRVGLFTTGFAWLAALLWVGFRVVCGLSMARDEDARPFIPVTPIRSLVQAPALPVQDGALIRVEGFLRGNVPIEAQKSKGSLYAFQYLTVTHTESNDGGETVSTREVTDGSMYYPQPLWLDVVPDGARKGRVEIRVPKDWEAYRFHTMPYAGDVGESGKIPDELAQMMGPGLDAIKPKSGQTWDLWAIPQNARVSVLAVARWDHGRTVLELDNDHWCIVSPDSWADLVGDGDPTVFYVAWFFMLLPLPWHAWKRARRRSGFQVLGA